MAQATLVWQLSRRLAPVEVTPAQRLIEVYGSYRWLEPSPMVDIMAMAFVPHLLAQARTCGQCGIAFVVPEGSLKSTCSGCRLYLRHRCRHFGPPLTVRPAGRYRELCTACQRARHRQSFQIWP
jgi:hypothetical protein